MNYVRFFECGQGSVVLAAVTGFKAMGQKETVAFVGDVAEGDDGAHGGRESGIDEGDCGVQLSGLESLDVAFEGPSVGHYVNEQKLVVGLGLELFDEAGEFGGVDLGRSLGVIAVFSVAGCGVLAALGGFGSKGEASVGAGGGDAAWG